MDINALNAIKTLLDKDSLTVQKIEETILEAVLSRIVIEEGKLLVYLNTSLDGKDLQERLPKFDGIEFVVE